MVKARGGCPAVLRTCLPGAHIFAGAWLGQGFHEDGLASAHDVAHGIAAREALAMAELAA
jgi:predicted NAD/FAD-binding protein